MPETPPLTIDRRRLASWVASAVGLLALPPAASGAVPTLGLASWFKVDEARSADWRVEPVEGDPLQATVRRVRPGAGPLRRLLVLYPRPSPAYDVAISKILEVLAAKNLNLELLAFNFQGDDGRGASALQMVEDGNLDLVLSMGSESTAWLHQYYRKGAVPVVTVCSKDPVALGQISGYEEGSGTNFAFTSLNMPIDVQLAYLLDFKPGLRNLGILVDGRNISAVRTQAKPMQQAAAAQGITVQYLAVQNPAKTKEELARLVGEATVQMRTNDPGLERSLFWITGSTAVFKEIATINAHAGRVPVVSAVPEVVQEGDDSAVLSIGISFESNANLAAIYAVDILAGRTTPGKLKVGIVSPPDIAINFRRARQIGLDVPISFFESANYIYDYDGRLVRRLGEPVATAPLR
jgi:putative ABC transport system substrate-binding protein